MRRQKQSKSDAYSATQYAQNGEIIYAFSQMRRQSSRNYAARPSSSFLPRFIAFLPPPSKNYAAEWAGLSRFLRRARGEQKHSLIEFEKSNSRRKVQMNLARGNIYICVHYQRALRQFIWKGNQYAASEWKKNKPESNWANYTSSSLWLRDQWAERDFISNSPFSHSQSGEIRFSIESNS